MSIESTLRTFLLTDSTLTGKIANRLFYAKAPQEVTKPYVVYYTLDNAKQKTMVGEDGTSPVLTFRIVTADSLDIPIIADAIEDKIKDYTGTVGGVKIHRIWGVGSRDFPDEGDGDFFERYDDYRVEYVR